MQIKTGIDIIEVNRIQNSIDELGDRFINKIYTPIEIEYCEKFKNAKYEHYAARFAAKEATFKAISEFLKDKYEISWKNMQVNNNADGKPILNFVSLDSKIEKDLEKVKNIDISLSHLKEYAIANVTLLIN